MCAVVLYSCQISFQSVHWLLRNSSSKFCPDLCATLYRYHGRTLPFFCSSLTTRPIRTKFGTFIARREADYEAKFHLAAFLHCWETVHESVVKLQRLLKQVKKWTFANGNETNCARVVFGLNSEMNFIYFFHKIIFCSKLMKKMIKTQKLW